MFSKKRFLQCISYGALMAVTALAPLTGRAETQTPEQIMNAAEQAYKQAYADLAAQKISVNDFLKAERDYASVLADHAPEITEEEKATSPLFKNRAPRDLPMKDRVRNMTPEEIDAYRAFLQKRVALTQRHLPGTTERVTQTVTNTVDKGADLLGRTISTPLGWVENGLTTAGEWVRDGLRTVSEKTGDNIVSPLVGTVVHQALGLTGHAVGSAGRVTDSAVQMTTHTLTNTLKAAATMTRNPEEAGLNLAADMTHTIAEGVGNALFETGSLGKGTAETVVALGRQSLDSALSVATTGVVQPTAAVVRVAAPQTADEIELWGMIGRAGISGHAVRPIEIVADRITETVMDTGQGVQLVSDMANPILRGHADFVSPEIMTDMTQAVHSFAEKKAPPPSMSTGGLKAQVMMAAVRPYTDSLTDEANFVYRQDLMTQLRVTAVKHGTKAAEKRAQAVQTDYALAVQALNEFEQAVKAVQSEKTTQTVRMARIKER